MDLTPEDIAACESDEELLERLLSELERRLAAQQSQGTEAFLEAARGLPRGLRAMAPTHALDVSMALDDLGCHFVNHSSRELALETRAGLEELGATEAAQAFAEALTIIGPFLEAIEAGGDVPWEDLERKLEPLNDRMWAICGQWPSSGLMHYWVTYARKHPEHVAG